MCQDSCPKTRAKYDCISISAGILGASKSQISIPQLHIGRFYVGGRFCTKKNHRNFAQKKTHLASHSKNSVTPGEDSMLGYVGILSSFAPGGIFPICIYTETTIEWNHHFI